MNVNYKQQIWAVGGGKGGVGKSIITANLGIILAQKGYKVLLVDADFGAANLHTVMGIGVPSTSLSDFFFEKKPLNELICPANLLNVDMIVGANDSLRVSNPGLHQVRDFISGLRTLAYDFILVDLGAGTMTHTVEMFISAHKGILVCMPEAAAVENTYRFMKYAFYRNMKHILRNQDILKFIDTLTVERDKNDISPLMLLEHIEKINPAEAEKVKKEMYSYSLKLIMNQARNNNDVRLGFSMTASCQKYFGFKLDYVGFVENDEVIVYSSRNRKPLYTVDPFAKSSRGIRKIAENLLNNEQVVTAII
ncbi:hypothetical protein CHS0354_030047 [Potamilus streckersoni]|uniref:ATP-binding protein n=1 Tax=Potamilus streckersoni TaxID=2493646 RepID=A0AAE0VGE1_9BIVA|nr:hypothetical protein CHS0354_030047 [Potamilus streckersoni]